MVVVICLTRPITVLAAGYSIDGMLSKSMSPWAMPGSNSAPGCLRGLCSQVQLGLGPVVPESCAQGLATLCPCPGAIAPLSCGCLQGLCSQVRLGLAPQDPALDSQIFNEIFSLTQSVGCIIFLFEHTHGPKSSMGLGPKLLGMRTYGQGQI